MAKPSPASLVDVSEAGRCLGVSVSTVWRMIRRGDLPSVRSGGRRLIPKDALQRELVERPAQQVPPLRPDHAIFRLVGAGRSGGQGPGARDKYAIFETGLETGLATGRYDEVAESLPSLEDE